MSFTDRVRSKGVSHPLRRGFTILEILTVVAILSILATIVFVNTSEARRKARNATRIHDIQQIAKAIDAYVIEHKTLPPLPTGSDPARPGVASTDIETSGSKMGWDEFLQTIGLNPLRDPLNGRWVTGAGQIVNQALWQYSYIVGLRGWTYDPDNNPDTHNYEYYDGNQFLPAVYARLEGGARPDTPLCDEGPVQGGGPLGAPTRSGYGSANCTDLTRGCIPLSLPPFPSYGEDPVVCIFAGYNSVD